MEIYPMDIIDKQWIRHLSKTENVSMNWLYSSLKFRVMATVWEMTKLVNN